MIDQEFAPALWSLSVTFASLEFQFKEDYGNPHMTSNHAFIAEIMLRLKDDSPSYQRYIRVHANGRVEFTCDEYETIDELATWVMTYCLFQDLRITRNEYH